MRIFSLGSEKQYSYKINICMYTMSFMCHFLDS